MIEVLSSLQNWRRDSGIDLKKSDAQDDVTREKLKQACHEFEALFISQMLKVMRETTENESGGMSLGEKNPFQGMFDWELSKRLSQSSPLGVVDGLMRRYAEENDDPLNNVGAVNLRKLPRLETTAFNLQEVINRAALENEIDPNLITAVIAAESDGNPRAVSSKGAKGLMQLMDSTAADLGVENSFNPSENVRGGVAYLKKMLDRFDGNLELALAAYNAGAENVERYGGIPPFKETQTYVKKVMDHIENLKNTNAEQALSQ